MGLYLPLGIWYMLMKGGLGYSVWKSTWQGVAADVDREIWIEAFSNGR